MMHANVLESASESTKDLTALFLLSTPMRSGRSRVANATGGMIFGRPAPKVTPSLDSRPFYEEIGVRRFAAVAGLCTLSISLWLFSAARVRIAVIPPDAFFYFNPLSAAYWLGLFSTLALLAARNLIVGKGRTWLELAGLFMLSLYLIGLPSFVYQNPRDRKSTRLNS